MWNYEKRLQFPVNIRKTCPKTASLIISQFGGPDGELAASMRYLSQRYSMPCRETGPFILISPRQDTLINETLDTILKSQLKKAGLSENSPADSLKKHKQELLTYDTDAGRIVFGYLDIKQDSVLILNYLSAELFLQK